jgi:hypothetical protein
MRFGLRAHFALIPVWIASCCASFCFGQVKEVAISTIEASGGVVKRASLEPDSDIIQIKFIGDKHTNESMAGLISELRELQPPDLVIVSPNFNDEGLSLLSSLDHVQTLMLNAHVTGEKVEQLIALKNLKELRFVCSAELTEEGMQKISKHEGIRRLILVGVPNVGDAGLQAISEMSQLEELTVTFCSATDVGLGHLQRLTKLERLTLTTNAEGHFSDEAIDAFRRAVPQCRVRSNKNNGKFMEPLGEQ